MIVLKINIVDTEFVDVSPRIGAPVLGLNPARFKINTKQIRLSRESHRLFFSY